MDVHTCTHIHASSFLFSHSVCFLATCAITEKLLEGKINNVVYAKLITEKFRYKIDWKFLLLIENIFFDAAAHSKESEMN